MNSHSDIERWVTAESAARQGDVGRIRNVTRGTKIHVPLIATFSQPQVGQEMSLAGTVQLVSPTGETVAEFRCFADSVDPRAPSTVVLNPVMGLTFDPTDASGEYRLIGRIERGGETAVAQERLRLE